MTKQRETITLVPVFISRVAATRFRRNERPVAMRSGLMPEASCRGSSNSFLPLQTRRVSLFSTTCCVVGKPDGRDDCRDGGDSVKWAGLQCGGARPRRLSAIFCRQKIRRRRAAAVSTQVVCVGWLGGGLGGESTFNQSDARPWSRTARLRDAFFWLIKCTFNIKEEEEERTRK